MNFIEDDLDTFKKDFADGLNPDQFEAFAKNPSDITEEVLFQLAPKPPRRTRLTV